MLQGNINDFYLILRGPEINRNRVNKNQVNKFYFMILKIYLEHF